MNLHAIRNYASLFLLCFICFSAHSETLAYTRTLTLPSQTQVTDFSSAEDIATAPDGTVWVANTSQRLLQHFDAGGNFIAEFDTQGGVRPHAITVAADNSLWVSDSDNYRIQHYSAAGTLLKQFGIQGQQIEPLNSSTDIGVATDGSIWLLELGNNRLQHFSSEGEWLGQITEEIFGTSKVIALTVAPDNSFWVAIGGENHGLRHYLSDGSLLAEIKNTPESYWDIETAADGSLWAVTLGASIHHLHADGRLIAQYGPQSDSHQQLTGRAIALASDDSVWVLDSGNQRIQHLTLTGAILTYSRAADEQLNSPVIADDGSLWTVNSRSHQILHYRADGQLIGAFDKSVAECLEQSSYLRRIALASDGSFWILDNYEYTFVDDFLTGQILGYGESCIQHFSADGQLLKRMRQHLENPNLATNRQYLALAPDGSFWLANTVLNQIEHFDAEGVKLSVINGNESGIGNNPELGEYQFRDLSGLVVAFDGSLWFTHNRLSFHRYQYAAVEHLSSEGNSLGQFGTQGIGVGQYTGAEGLALAADGSLWVVDSNHRIQHVRVDGSFIEQFEVYEKNKPGFYNLLSGITVAKDGSLWIENATLKHVYHYQPQDLRAAIPEYDARRNVLFINDVEVTGGHFQATLGYNDDKFYLLSFNLATQRVSTPASYLPETGTLNLPQVMVNGQGYRAVLKLDTDALYHLESLSIAP